MLSRDLSGYEATCVIIHHTNSPDEQDSTSCSAIFLSPTHILAPGCLLNFDDQNGFNANGNFEVIIKNNSGNLERLKADVVTSWKCHPLFKSLNDLFSTSSITPNSVDDSGVVDINSLSTFIILKIAPCCHCHNTLKCINSIEDPRTGAEVMVCSTPFGSNYSDSFFNSWIAGSVSKCVEAECGLYLCDLTCVPGMQGGVVFLRKSMTIVGMVIHPVIWRPDECTGLSLIVSFTTIISSLQLSCSDLNKTLSPTSLKTLSNVNFASPDTRSPCFRLVRLKVGATWGSGIIISPLYILTCAHVLDGHHHSTVVWVKAYQGDFRATVAYKSSNKDSFDVAVLRLDAKLPNMKVISPALTTKVGMEVIAQGFGIFEQGRSAIITKGIVMNLSLSGKYLHTIITSCKVHSGSSGGLFLDTSGGMIGMITSNVYDQINKLGYTHIGMGLSLDIMHSQIKLLDKEDNFSGFSALETELTKNHENCFMKSKL